MKVSYGFAIPTADLVPVVPPNPFFGDFGGTWEDWCDVNYWTPENNAKCRVCPQTLFGHCVTPAPHTMLGRAARGLPQQTDLQTLGPPPGTETPPPNGIPPDVDTGDSWFEKNKLLVFGGAGVVALGLIAFAMKGRGRRMNGFAGMLGFRHKRRRARKARRN